MLIKQIQILSDSDRIIEEVLRQNQPVFTFFPQLSLLSKVTYNTCIQPREYGPRTQGISKGPTRAFLAESLDELNVASRWAVLETRGMKTHNTHTHMVYSHGNTRWGCLASDNVIAVFFPVIWLTTGSLVSSSGECFFFCRANRLGNTGQHFPFFIHGNLLVHCSLRVVLPPAAHYFEKKLLTQYPPATLFKRSSEWRHY